MRKPLVNCPTKADLTVRCLSGGSYRFVNAKRWLVAELKEYIKLSTQIPTHEQHLIHEGRTLNEHAHLPVGATDITLVRCLRHPAWPAWKRTAQRHPMRLASAPHAILADRDIFLAALATCRGNRNGACLQFASEGLRNDYALIHFAVKHDGLLIRFASASLKANREIAIAAVQQTSEALDYVSDDVRCDQKVVLTAVRSDWSVLRSVSEELRDNYEIALTAVRSNGHALEFVGESLRGDPAIVLEAARQDRSSLAFATEAARANRNLILQVVALDGRALEFASEALRADQVVVLEALNQNSVAIVFASEELRQDKAFLAKAIACNGRTLSHIPVEWQTDDHLLQIAMDWWCPKIYRGCCLHSIPKALQGHPDLVDAAIWLHGQRAEAFEESFASSDEEKSIEHVPVQSGGNSPMTVTQTLRGNQHLRHLLCLKQSMRERLFRETRIDKQIVLLKAADLKAQKLVRANRRLSCEHWKGYDAKLQRLGRGKLGWCIRKNVDLEVCAFYT